MPSNPKNTRLCIACRGRSDKSEMIRVVRGADGKIAVDCDKNLEGRGAWIHDNDECKAKTVRRKLLNSAFKTGVAEEIYEQIKG